MALVAPLLDVDFANMGMEVILPPCGVATSTWPGTGVADATVDVDSFDVTFPVTILTKTLSTVLTLERFDLIVYNLDMPVEIHLHGKFASTYIQ